MTVSDLQHDAEARRNLELKVRLTRGGLDAVRDRLARLGTSEPDVQQQEDRYFAVPGGRLKLRTIICNPAELRSELIAYRRPDEHGSRWSTYSITPLGPEQAASLAVTLAQVLPERVVIRKRREIYLHGATRIHLDDVQELGAFVELETVMSEQSTGDAATEHQFVIDTLGLAGWPVEAGSYSDLLERSRHQGIG
ncbi:MAG TPA: class IV adenylate cyclase [Thermomicrobiales bacterium]|nr:class IV adenylate cyclase [Thermomicrobiales bacterium]